MNSVSQAALESILSEDIVPHHCKLNTFAFLSWRGQFLNLKLDLYLTLLFKVMMLGLFLITSFLVMKFLPILKFELKLKFLHKVQFLRKVSPNSYIPFSTDCLV